MPGVPPAAKIRLASSGGALATGAWNLPVCSGVGLGPAYRVWAAHNVTFLCGRARESRQGRTFFEDQGVIVVFWTITVRIPQRVGVGLRTLGLDLQYGRCHPCFG